MLGKMLRKVGMMYALAKANWQGLKEDEDAMEVIQVVMLIAVGVLAIAAVWAGVNGLLKTWWDAIIGGSGTQDIGSLPTTP